MKQYFAVVNNHTILSGNKDSIIEWLESWGIKDIEVCSDPEIKKYQGIRIKGKGVKGESFSASSHTEFYEILKEII